MIKIFEYDILVPTQTTLLTTRQPENHQLSVLIEYTLLLGYEAITLGNEHHSLNYLVRFVNNDTIVSINKIKLLVILYFNSFL